MFITLNRFSDFEKIYANWQETTSSVYRDIVFTKDGYIITHGIAYCTVTGEGTTAIKTVQGDDYINLDVTSAGQLTATFDKSKLLELTDALKFAGTATVTNGAFKIATSSSLISSTTGNDLVGGIGYVYKVVTPGTVGTDKVEVGDMIIYTSATEYTIVQNNLDASGFVTGIKVNDSTTLSPNSGIIDLSSYFSNYLTSVPTYSLISTDGKESTSAVGTGVVAKYLNLVKAGDTSTAVGSIEIGTGLELKNNILTVTVENTDTWRAIYGYKNNAYGNIVETSTGTKALSFNSSFSWDDSGDNAVVGLTWLEYPENATSTTQGKYYIA